ncbi:MAG: transglycosylase domain-containing protein [Oscillospiraceae bacterium]|nr:transglycosylase domain-containing protein [Oscillospiraceae bacterium]
MSKFFSNFNKKRNNQKPRQEWEPHWSLKAASGIVHSAAAVVKVAMGAVATVLLILLVCGFVFAGILGEYLESDILPNAAEDLDGHKLEQTSYVYYIDSEGDIQEQQRIYTVTDRRWATIDEIPRDLMNAAVAIEDQRFYEHQGVDWVTTVKACANMFVGSSSTFGGSTITQQLIKNLTGDDDVTVQRKLTEIFKAIHFERQYDKETIMEWYLNTIYFGYGKYGVRSAAEQYFGKELEMLTTAECAALISITNNPSLFNPYSEREFEYRDYGMTNGADRNNIRKTNTLWSMRNQGYLTEEAYQEALAQELEYKSEIAESDRLVRCSNGDCGYFGTVTTFVADESEAGVVYACPSCGEQTQIDSSASQQYYSWFTEAVIDDVCADLAAQEGVDWNKLSASQKTARRDELKLAGYHIYSTMDMEVQQAVDNIYTDLSKIPTTQSSQQLLSAIVIVDNKTGDIVAMAGNVGEKDTFFGISYATDAKLQTGSTQKPLSVYAPAFESGIITPASVISDMPLYYSNGTPFPRNDNRQYQYSRNIYTGIMRSVNAISVNVLEKLGLENSYEFAKEKFRLNGLTNSYVTSSGREMTDVGYAPLGMGALTTGVTVADMASAYATFANNGVYREGRTYTKVYDSEGNLVLDNTQETEQILSEKTVNYMNYCLTAAVQSGTGTSAQISGQTVAGKTGTTSSNFDRWFCGFTEYYTAAVWCGYKWPEQIRLTGEGTNPACRLFKAVLTPVHAGLSNVKLYDSGDMRSYSMCLDSGMRAGSSCSNTTSALAYSGDVSEGYCDKHTSVEWCNSGNGAANEYCKLMGASIGSKSLVKLSSDEVSAIRSAMKAGLSSGYPNEKNVYYTGGGWHGYSGSLQSGSSEHYIVCTEHNAKAYADSQVPEEPEEDEEKPEEGSDETANAHHEH